MAERDDRVEGLGVQGYGGQARIVRVRGTPVLDGDRDVDLPVEHHRQTGVALGVLDVDVDAGCRAGEPGERGATTRPMPVARQATVTVPAEPAGELRLGTLQLGQHLVGVAEQDLAGRSQPYALGAALDEPAAGLLLQRGQLLGDGRGGDRARRPPPRRPCGGRPPHGGCGAAALRSCDRFSQVTGVFQPSSSARADTNASTARFTSCVECAAESWTRIRAWPCGTTG